ncbi:hypothetical protein [Clostridium cochlearium]|uniref:hypothetical protein n=1 Tax=Clostridium cochlearium TaxID=1494 RepID=UPI0015708248|nr:hypothetical protein [Clostridium cochlearium]MBV1820072.1 hypothetical protein [Bacteroidales bacterium MSK.15.36]MCG4580538.1 hypothetical protein [Clostridium cochlearium]
MYGENIINTYHISISKEDNEVYDKIYNNPKIDKVGLKESEGDVSLRDEKKINGDINKNVE